jgi:hypothetical protein
MISRSLNDTVVPACSWRDSARTGEYLYLTEHNTFSLHHQGTQLVSSHSHTQHMGIRYELTGVQYGLSIVQVVSHCHAGHFDLAFSCPEYFRVIALNICELQAPLRCP